MSSKRRLVVNKWMENFIIGQSKYSTELKDQIALYLYNTIINYSFYNKQMNEWINQSSISWIPVLQIF